jgi:hypothetical protein
MMTVASTIKKSAIGWIAAFACMLAVAPFASAETTTIPWDSATSIEYVSPSGERIGGAFGEYLATSAACPLVPANAAVRVGWSDSYNAWNSHTIGISGGFSFTSPNKGSVGVWVLTPSGSVLAGVGGAADKTGAVDNGTSWSPGDAWWSANVVQRVKVVRSCGEARSFDYARGTIARGAPPVYPTYPSVHSASISAPAGVWPGEVLTASADWTNGTNGGEVGGVDFVWNTTHGSFVGSEYVVTTADIGKSISVTATAGSSSATSTGASVPVAASVVEPPKAEISGGDRIVLIAAGLADGAGRTDKYVWSRCTPDGTSCADVMEGAGPYILSAADKEQEVFVRLESSNPSNAQPASKESKTPVSVHNPYAPTALAAGTCDKPIIGTQCYPNLQPITNESGLTVSETRSVKITDASGNTLTPRLLPNFGVNLTEDMYGGTVEFTRILFSPLGVEEFVQTSTPIKAPTLSTSLLGAPLPVEIKSSDKIKFPTPALNETVLSISSVGCELVQSRDGGKSWSPDDGLHGVPVTSKVSTGPTVQLLDPADEGSRVGWSCTWTPSVDAALAFTDVVSTATIQRTPHPPVITLMPVTGGEARMGDLLNPPAPTLDGGQFDANCQWYYLAPGAPARVTMIGATDEAIIPGQYTGLKSGGKIQRVCSYRNVDGRADQTTDWYTLKLDAPRLGVPTLSTSNGWTKSSIAYVTINDADTGADVSWEWQKQLADGSFATISTGSNPDQSLVSLVGARVRVLATITNADGESVSVASALSDKITASTNGGGSGEGTDEGNGAGGTAGADGATDTGDNPAGYNSWGITENPSCATILTIPSTATCNGHTISVTAQVGRADKAPRLATISGKSKGATKHWRLVRVKYLVDGKPVGVRIGSMIGNQKWFLLSKANGDGSVQRSMVVGAGGSVRVRASSTADTPALDMVVGIVIQKPAMRLSYKTTSTGITLTGSIKPLAKGSVVAIDSAMRNARSAAIPMRKGACKVRMIKTLVMGSCDLGFAPNALSFRLRVTNPTAYGKAVFVSAWPKIRR